jgi:hypothetical protein
MTTTTDLRRKALRAAVKIRDHLLGKARCAPQATVPQGAWDGLSKTLKRLRYTERQGWQAASQALLLDADYTLGRLERELGALRQNLASRTSPKLVISASEIAADLIALQDEFERVELDLKELSVMVLTAPITLEDVDLGPFRIVLPWEQIGSTPAYSVSAEEPNCPDERSDVTHPHVQENCLWEGDGSAAITAALSAGRVLDFFVLIRQILGTYNVQSAHVLLVNWHATGSCSGCGTSTSDDDSSSCERCDDRFCADCIWSCNACGSCVCSHCSDSCAHCDQRFCNRCLTARAGTIVLLCKTCLEDQPEDPSHETKNEAPAEPATGPISTAV